MPKIKMLRLINKQQQQQNLIVCHVKCTSVNCFG
uniref:Uncharacterized protein n=1 Tax=Anguilla anguilla TaxID=7936 RepID=A0A0E9WJM1_ANGAN